jgi:hypothetical protein
LLIDLIHLVDSPYQAILLGAFDVKTHRTVFEIALDAVSVSDVAKFATALNLLFLAKIPEVDYIFAN